MSKRAVMLLLLGAAVLVYGVWLVYAPAAWILAGLLLIGLGVGQLEAPGRATGESPR